MRSAYGLAKYCNELVGARLETGSTIVRDDGILDGLPVVLFEVRDL